MPKLREVWGITISPFLAALQRGSLEFLDSVHPPHYNDRGHRLQFIVLIRVLEVRE